MNDIIREFLLESYENLAQLDLDLVTLEKDPGERETLSRAFRSLHTVKGTAGFLGLARLERLSHAAETLLSRLRSGELTFNAEIATALLGTVDAVRKMLANLEASETEGDAEYPEIIAELTRLSRTTARPKPPGTETIPILVPPPRVLPEAKQPVSPPPVATPPRAAPEAVEVRAPAVADTTVRIDVGLLDTLMTLVSELVLARNQIVQFSADNESPALTGSVQRLNQLTSELQIGVMKTRLQPIGVLWTKLPRVVRDLAIGCGKQVVLDVQGADTELDRTILEAVRDPLTHLIRNAIDHGIEAPPRRAAAGKPAEGQLGLRAFHEGGKVVIELSDDGAGIDPNRIREKALAAKLITPDQAEGMSERAILRLIFLPGFSTADRVSNLSGRGVGMDVVLTNIEKIGGVVEIESHLGSGTTVRLKIPLTLAIIPALIVTAGGERFAIPQVSLIELLRIDRARGGALVENVYGIPVYRLRDSLLPLIYLDRTLKLEALRTEEAACNVVVVQADDRRFGLVVDEILDTEEIVVKPLQRIVKSAGPGPFVGATIMGDGRVALILDVPGLAQRGGVISGLRTTAGEVESPDPVPVADRHSLLLFAPSQSGRGRCAVPVEHVLRLEEFDRSAVETVAGQPVLQYRGEILPLIHVGRALRSRGSVPRRPRRAPRRAEPLQVVVCSSRGRQVGLIVGRILDIVDEVLTSRSDPIRSGVLFNAVVQDRVTEFLDVEALFDGERNRTSMGN